MKWGHLHLMSHHPDELPTSQLQPKTLTKIDECTGYNLKTAVRILHNLTSTASQLNFFNSIYLGARVSTFQRGCRQQLRRGSSRGRFRDQPVDADASGTSQTSSEPVWADANPA